MKANYNGIELEGTAEEIALILFAKKNPAKVRKTFDTSSAYKVPDDEVPLFKTFMSKYSGTGASKKLIDESKGIVDYPAASALFSSFHAGSKTSTFFLSANGERAWKALAPKLPKLVKSA